MMRRTVILFVRQPRLGTGKRRLARDIGPVAALRFERLMLARSLRRLGHDRRWKLKLAVTPDRAATRSFKRVVGRNSEAHFALNIGRQFGGLRRAHPPYDIVAQGQGDLGARMRRALSAFGPGPRLLIGSDIPALTGAHVVEAFGLLGRHDVIVGPAGDGGFWLVGCRHRPPDFGKVRWSSPHALEDTLANLPRGVSVGFAATLDDVDDGGAYRKLRRLRGF